MFTYAYINIVFCDMTEKAGEYVYYRVLSFPQSDLFRGFLMEIFKVRSIFR
jgi:hypothetical protein